jgi:hypothetical protein
VVLHDTEYVPFMACLEFIYTGNVKIPDPDFAIELVCVPHTMTRPHGKQPSLCTNGCIRAPCVVQTQIGEANKLQLVRLKALCEDLISKNIDIENAAYVYQVASYHAVPRLRSIALVHTHTHTLALLRVSYLSSLRGFCDSSRASSLSNWQDFVVTNFDQVSKTKTFAEMDRALLLEVMQEACKLVTQTRGSSSSSSSSSSS